MSAAARASSHRASSVMQRFPLSQGSEPLSSSCYVDAPRATEISQHEPRRGLEMYEYVCWLEIAMHHAAQMHVCEPSKTLRGSDLRQIAPETQTRAPAKNTPKIAISLGKCQHQPLAFTTVATEQLEHVRMRE